MLALPKLNYFSQTLPITIDSKDFAKWQEICTSCIYQGKRPQLTKTLMQKRLDQGGWGEPSLSKYYEQTTVSIDIVSDRPWVGMELSGKYLELTEKRFWWEKLRHIK